MSVRSKNLSPQDMRESDDLRLMALRYMHINDMKLKDFSAAHDIPYRSAQLWMAHGTLPREYLQRVKNTVDRSLLAVPE